MDLNKFYVTEDAPGQLVAHMEQEDCNTEDGQIVFEYTFNSANLGGMCFEKTDGSDYYDREENAENNLPSIVPAEWITLEYSQFADLIQGGDLYLD